MEKDYVILNIEKEYPGYTGTEKWLIITDLSEEVFSEMYPEQYPYWREAVIVSMEMGKEIIRYHNNEKKHEMRKRRSEIPLDIDRLKDIPAKAPKERGICNPKLIASVKTLSETEERRILKHCVYNYPLKEIALQEKCSPSAVRISIRRGLNKMRLFLEAETGGLGDA